MDAELTTWLRELARDRAGLQLAADNSYLLETRLGPLARSRRAASVGDFLETLRAQPDEALRGAVVEALLTNETCFFRDRAPFEQLRDLLPGLARSRAGGTLRVWSAACSTGQEAYSLAMLLDELSLGQVDLCASDLSERALTKARSGFYTQFEVQRGLPIRSLLRYFDKVDEAWRVKPRLRQRVRWRRFNLLDDMRPLGRFDAICCRNVLMYFDAPTKQRVLEQLAGALAPDGYLLLGASEAAMDVTDAFQPTAGRQGVYTPNPAFRRAA